MYVITLKFGQHREKASLLMDAHNMWIRRGFEDGVFLLTGGLKPSAGGLVLAHQTTRDALETRVQADPFVVEGVVTAEIMEVSPGRTDERLDFLRA